jgi:hypothetical protein
MNGAEPVHRKIVPAGNFSVATGRTPIPSAEGLANNQPGVMSALGLSKARSRSPLKEQRTSVTEALQKEARLAKTGLLPDVFPTSREVSSRD